MASAFFPHAPPSPSREEPTVCKPLTVGTPLPAGLPRLFCSYHPSQQNTQTGRLTPEMFQQVLRDISEFLGA